MINMNVQYRTIDEKLNFFFIKYIDSDINKKVQDNR